MKAARSIIVGILLAIVLATGWRYFQHRPSPVADRVTAYYTQLDGTTERGRAVALGDAHDSRSVAFFAATQAVAGPPEGVAAVRFPTGTRVLSVDLDGSTATVDLSNDVDRLAGGSFTESGAFKSLVWTLTALPGINAVRIRVDGGQIAAIPGGHLELDEPLTRSSW